MGRYVNFLDSNGEIRYIAVHSGCALEEYISNFELNCEHFADRCQMPLDMVWRICHGTQDITPSIAACLSSGTKIEKSFWTNLQEHYNQKMKEETGLGYTLEYTYISDLGGNNG